MNYITLDIEKTIKDTQDLIKRIETTLSGSYKEKK